MIKKERSSKSTFDSLLQFKFLHILFIPHISALVRCPPLKTVIASALNRGSHFLSGKCDLKFEMLFRSIPPIVSHFNASQESVPPADIRGSWSRLK